MKIAEQPRVTMPERQLVRASASGQDYYQHHRRIEWDGLSLVEVLYQLDTTTCLRVQDSGEQIQSQ
jgi:hypothetical protein